MMRTLIVHSGNLYGGLERALETFARAAEYGAPLDVSCALCFDGPIADVLRRRGVEPTIIGDVRLTRPHQVLRARRRMASLLAHASPDVVMTTAPWTHAIFAPVVARAGIPLVLWLHDTLSGMPWLEKLAGRHQPQLLIANSACCLDAARSVYPSVPARVVYSPVVFAEAVRTRAETRRALGVPEETPLIINVARMEPGKGQSVLLDALADTDPTWTCWIVGGAQTPDEREYARALQQQATTLGLAERVQFLGQRADVADLLAAADVCCHPHVGIETFGLAIAEALHAGLPVVASDLGGAREILTNELGELVPAGDAPALRAALSRLLAGTSKDSAAARRRSHALALCDPARRFADFSQALESVCHQVTHA